MTPGQHAYQAYLLTEHWRELRAVVLARDGFKCTRCPSGKRLQAHHTFYRDKFEESQPEDLITLCRACHKREHGIKTPSPKHKKQRSKRHFKPKGKPDTQNILSQAEKRVRSGGRLKQWMRDAVAKIARDVYYIHNRDRAKEIQRLHAQNKRKQPKPPISPP